MYLLVFALTGCVSYVPRPLSPQEALDSARARSLEDPQLQAEVIKHLQPEATRPPVWTLDSLAWAAYRLNPDLAVARAKLDVAHSGEAVAGERPNPTLVFPFEYATNPNQGDSPYTIGLALDISVETGGKRDARIAQAAQLSRVAELELGEAAWQVRGRLRAALLDLRHAQRDEVLLAMQVHRRELIAQMLSHRLSLGELARPDLAQAAADLAQVRQQLVAARQAIVQARSAVAEAVGVSTASVVRADVRVDDLERLPASAMEARVQDEALKNRSDVQAALAGYEASQAALQLAVASQYPDIHLGPGYTFDGGVHKYALSLSGIELPLFSLHRGEIDEAEAKRRQAAAQFDGVMAQAIAQVDQATAALRGAQAQFQQAEQSFSGQQRVLAAAQRSFDVGAIGRLDLAVVALQADSAAVQREEVFDRLLRASAALEDAVQRPLAASPTSAQKEHE